MCGPRAPFLHVIWSEGFNAVHRIQANSFYKMHLIVIKTLSHQPFYSYGSPNCSRLRIFNVRAVRWSSKKCSERGSNGPRLRIHYGNYGRTRSNSNCYPLGLTDIDCISPRASRFIESACSVKGSPDQSSPRQSRLDYIRYAELLERKTSMPTWYSDTFEQLSESRLFKWW